MADDTVEIHGYLFSPTEDGHLRVPEVRERIGALSERLLALEAENVRLRQQVEHLDSLKRLAESTIVRADELAAEIEAEARARADDLVRACEEELAERKREFEKRQVNEVQALHVRTSQLQVALDNATRALGDALKAVEPAGDGDGAATPPSGQGVATDLPNTVPVTAPAPDSTPRPDAPAAAQPTPSAQRPPGYAAAPLTSVTPTPASSGPPTAPSAPPGPTLGAAPEATASRVPPVVGGAAPKEQAPANQGPTLVTVPPATTDAAPPPRVEGDVTFGGVSKLVSASSGPAPAAAESYAELLASLDDPDRTQEAVVGSGDAPRPQSGAPGMPGTSVPPRPLGMLPPHAPEPGTPTVEIDMRPVRSFSDLARVTKLLGQIAPGAQPVDLNLPQHRALFAVHGHVQAKLVEQLQGGLPDAVVRERAGGIDVILEPGATPASNPTP